MRCLCCFFTVLNSWKNHPIMFAKSSILWWLFFFLYTEITLGSLKQKWQRKKIHSVAYWRKPKHILHFFAALKPSFECVDLTACVCVCVLGAGVWWCRWRKPLLAAWQWTQWEAAAAAAAHLPAWQLAAAPTSLLPPPPPPPQTPKAWSIPRVGQTQGRGALAHFRALRSALEFLLHSPPPMFAFYISL